MISLNVLQEAEVFWVRMHIEEKLDEILSGRKNETLRRTAALSKSFSSAPSVFFCKMLDDDRYADFHETIEEIARYGMHDILARILDDFYDGEILGVSSVKSKVKFARRAMPNKKASRKERLSKRGLLDHLLEVAQRALSKHPHKHMRSGLVVAALLHDAGKCSGLCRNYGIDESFGHEAAGAQYAKILSSEFPDASLLLDTVAASLDPSLEPKLRNEAKRNIFVALVAEADRETRIQESKEYK